MAKELTMYHRPVIRMHRIVPLFCHDCGRPASRAVDYGRGNSVYDTLGYCRQCFPDCNHPTEPHWSGLNIRKIETRPGWFRRARI